MQIENKRTFPSIGITLAGLVALALPRLAFAQGCALCYTQAANSGARIIQALRDGIVILIIPPVLMCLGAMVLAYRKRNQFHQADARPESGSDW